MKIVLVLGYSAFDLGIFDEKDIKITVIKKAVRRQLENYAEQGLVWLIFTGTLGFEYWVLQVAQEMKEDYGFQLATIFDFESHGQNWNEANKLKLSEFKTLDYVKYCFENYESPGQFRQYNDFLIENAEGAFVFYDEENETKLKYMVSKMKETEDFQLDFLNFERLQEIAEEMND